MWYLLWPFGAAVLCAADRPAPGLGECCCSIDGAGRRFAPQARWQMNDLDTRLIMPDTPQWFDATREIFREYAQALAVDLAFQHFDDELASLPGEYGPPDGLLLLALVDGGVAGCGAFRRLNDVDYPNACEMKRLYVRRPFRRFGLGRVLAEALIDHAREAGYSTMLLDTLDDMESARELYASLGFENVAPYYYNPLPGAHYLKVDLGASSSRY